jgi:hypothetical protein
MSDINFFTDLLVTTRLIISRLERLSADSRWAHRASGLRGSLLRSLDQLEASLQQPGSAIDPKLTQSLEVLNQQGTKILVLAARDIRVPEHRTTLS